MVTLTAQILVGNPYPDNDGINPTHYLFLCEDGRPAWILVEQNIFQEEQSSFSKITWLPTIENILEDAFLMVAIHILKNREIIKMARDFNIRVDAKRVDFYSNLNDVQRNTLYRKCREISDFPKIIISVFRGSTIENRLSVLERYKIDFEVCQPIYPQLYSSWKNETGTEKDLSILI